MAGDAEKPIKDFKDNWRDRRIFYLKRKYGKRFEEWKDAGHRDDRIVYCNIYRLQLEALESLPADPLNYICVAMNDHMKRDRATMDSILETFKGR